jgi:alkanesulfonate monooxygenase SsuD/methylene tetrahydromethanopterin reductase-like flavin-dependent oxidoreductase (luciferase family)
MKTKKRIVIIFDDGGGIALGVYADKYAHYYDYPSQLADDLLLFRETGTTDDWDNNQWYDYPAGDDILFSDQSTREYYGTPDQVIKDILRDYTSGNSYGMNHDKLATALKGA